MERAEWEAARTDPELWWLGGSDAYRMRGHWGTKLQVWAEKCRLVPPEPIDPELDEFGHAMEPVIARALERRTGLRIHLTAGNKVVRHNPERRIGCTLDGSVHESGIFEAKNLNGMMLAEWEANGPSEAVFIQCQHNMMCADEPTAYVAVLFGGQRFRHWEIEADPEFQAALLEEELELIRCIEERREPPAADEDRKLLATLHPEAEDTIVDLPADAVSWDLDLRAVEAAITEGNRDLKALKERRAELRGRFGARIGSAAFGRLPGGTSFYERAIVRGSVVYRPAKKLPANIA